MMAWLWATVMLGGAVQAAAPKEFEFKLTPAMVRGLLAALDDPDEAVVSAAFSILATGNAQRDPEARARLESFIRGPRVVRWLEDPKRDSLFKTLAALKAMGKLAKEQAPRIGELLKDPSENVRIAAANALGAMGEDAKDQAPLLCAALKGSSYYTVRAVARALGAMGKAARNQAPCLADLAKEPMAISIGDVVWALSAMGELTQEQRSRVEGWLKDPNPQVLIAAVDALGAMGEAAKNQAPRLGDLLKDPNNVVRMTAADALGAMGEAAKDQGPRLVELLDDPDLGIRSVAARALGAMGATGKQEASRLGSLLKDPDTGVRRTAAEALGAMGKAAKDQAPRLGDLLKDPDTAIRRAAAKALPAMGEAAQDQSPRLVDLLKDPDESVLMAAADALMAMGGAARDQFPRLGDLLKDPDERVRLMAAGVMGATGGAPIEYAAGVGSFLQDKEEKVRRGAAQVLATMAPLPLPHVAAILAMVGTEPGNRSNWIMLAHAAGGGDPKVERVLRWLGQRASSDLPKELTIDEARETLRTFDELWPATERYPLLRDDLAQQIARVADVATGQWASDDLTLLTRHEDHLKASYRVHAQSLRSARASIERWTTARSFAWTWAGHIGFWVLLLFFYPRSPQVQAVFFWNPWVRTITGFGYVGLLLTWVPFLRHRLLSPFASQLLADADLERFSAESYFKDSDIILQPSGRREPLLTALPRLRGQVILEGASGLGKSLFIKYLLRHSQRLAVFLPAERCKDGVLEAIQARLEGHAKDTAFLQSIIYSGALDIYIDGLNEVTADTRARIVEFVERNFHGNILLATQRMEWSPPTTARLYVLQPLSDARISEFLVSREPLLGEKARLRGPEYREACERFVKNALAPEQPEELRRAMREVLSNPMDLTVITQMLSEGYSPDLFRLRQQQYELMARDYIEVNLAEFPLKEFAEESYKMRLEDRPSLTEDRFGKELLRLEAFKMVVRRQWQDPKGQQHREWRFRHDKLQEFFIAQTFLGAGNPRIVEHMGDPRFRGVYFLLALLLEPENARQLRDLLVVRAAQTRDHTVSDEFVTLLEARRGAEQAQLKPSPALQPTGATA